MISAAYVRTEYGRASELQWSRRSGFSRRTILLRGSAWAPQGGGRAQAKDSRAPNPSRTESAAVRRATSSNAVPGDRETATSWDQRPYLGRALCACGRRPSTSSITSRKTSHALAQAVGSGWPTEDHIRSSRRKIVGGRGSRSMSRRRRYWFILAPIHRPLSSSSRVSADASR